MKPELVEDLLRQAGLAGRDQSPVIEPLTGGVSSGIFKVSVGSKSYCVKQALPKLKVKKDWRVPTDRVFAEIAWLRLAAGIVPGHVPRVLTVNEQEGAFLMEFLDEEVCSNWKDQLMQGIVEQDAGREVASVLGKLHKATAKDPDVNRRFQNSSNFYLLRLEPYLVETAFRNPDLAVELIELVHSLQHHSLVLMHGDFSPKNIFLGPDGAIVLDAECACIGDPAFDVAFLLNHLLLKSVFRPQSRAGYLGLLQEAWKEYANHVTWESTSDLEARVACLLPALMLARVDGKSPVEYLSREQQSVVREFARQALVRRSISIFRIAEDWESAISAEVAAKASTTN